MNTLRQAAHEYLSLRRALGFKLREAGKVLLDFVTFMEQSHASTFTAEEFTRVVRDKGCKLSMDGRGAWRDNVFVKRLWRSVKYERVYLKAYDSVSAARADVADYLDWYNTQRPHSSLERLTPEEMYCATLPPMARTA